MSEVSGSDEGSQDEGLDQTIASVIYSQGDLLKVLDGDGRMHLMRVVQVTPSPMESYQPFTLELEDIGEISEPGASAEPSGAAG